MSKHAHPTLASSFFCVCMGLSETDPSVPTLETESVERRHRGLQEHHPQNGSWGYFRVTDEDHITENPFHCVMTSGQRNEPGAQCPSSLGTRHTGPSVIPSRGKLGALSAVGLSSFFSEVGTRRLTYGLWHAVLARGG